MAQPISLDSTKPDRASLRGFSLQVDIRIMFPLYVQVKSRRRCHRSQSILGTTNSPIKQLTLISVDRGRDLTQPKPNTSAAFDGPAASGPSNAYAWLLDEFEGQAIAIPLKTRFDAVPWGLEKVLYTKLNQVANHRRVHGRPAIVAMVMDGSR
ncbi:uncharacterized protein LY79DRAFT_335093 [Colletotrichum navitas]|uniref:Uncharacterized protein n=1 Tax=Colletotrichum navitas TaxID=681940 RepID=A0AAD8PS88_9PEZI|nr:uncharacterized protein LY79DRAFT_335093 [Colletotrichum navitas]KAK1579783.1 hypothetical protein LY79DRAFT_335093 [Colletotrichum navitas]